MLAGELPEAEALLTDAYFDALEVGSVEVGFRWARTLMSTLLRQERHGEALVWSRHAEVLAAALDDPGQLDAAEGHYLLGTIYVGLGEFERAIVEGERAVAMRSAVLGPEHPITAAAARTLGKAYLEGGHPREALALFESTASSWADAFDREHPYIADLERQRGRAAFALGQPEEALVHMREGLAIEEALRGDRDPSLAPMLAELGDVYAALGGHLGAGQSNPTLSRVDRKTSIGSETDHGVAVV